MYVIILWIIVLSDHLFDLELSKFGVYPLHVKGLLGIFLSPLIHGNLEHLASNTLPLLVLGTMLFYFYPKSALKVFILLYFVTSIWVWFGARPAYHIGSSGIVYGLASFIFTSGAILLSIRLMAVSLLVVFLYGSMIWGLFPINWKISWEAHLSGFVLGIILAFFYKNENYNPNDYPEWMNEEDEDDYDDNLNNEIPYWQNNNTTSTNIS